MKHPEAFVSGQSHVLALYLCVFAGHFLKTHKPACVTLPPDTLLRAD